jgi:hypothetical protein
MPFPRWTAHPPTFASMVKESVKVCEVVHTPKKSAGPASTIALVCGTFPRFGAAVRAKPKYLG